MILIYNYDHTDQELYTCCCWVIVVEEGTIENIFDDKDGPDIIPLVVDQIEEGETLNAH